MSMVARLHVALSVVQLILLMIYAAVPYGQPSRSIATALLTLVFAISLALVVSSYRTRPWWRPGPSPERYAIPIGLLAGLVLVVLRNNASLLAGLAAVFLLTALVLTRAAYRDRFTQVRTRQVGLAHTLDAVRTASRALRTRPLQWLNILTWLALPCLLVHLLNAMVCTAYVVMVVQPVNRLSDMVLAKVHELLRHQRRSVRSVTLGLVGGIIALAPGMVVACFRP